MLPLNHFGIYEHLVRVNGRAFLGCGHTPREAKINAYELAREYLPLYMTTVVDYMLGEPLAWRKRDEKATELH